MPHSRFAWSALAVVAVVLGLLLTFATAARAQQGWTVTSFHSEITIERDGDVHFVETIAVDFGVLERHGIIREIVTRQRCGEVSLGDVPLTECPGGSDRLYPFELESVTDASGSPHDVQVSTEGGSTFLRIGDPDVTISGPQTYRIAYTLGATLNEFQGHDELYWNVTGNRWEVPLEQVTASVRLDGDASVFVTCFEGYASNQNCNYTSSGNQAEFQTTRTMFPYEELTIVVGWDKGAVTVQAAVLDDRLSPDDFFSFDWLEWGGLGTSAVIGFLGLVRAWWVFGRDRRYKTLQYLSGESDEHTAPLFHSRDVVVEFLPPEDLRPAQLGVIVDERADTLDVTATIVDLAVRGYLKINELEKRGWFGRQDWQLQQLKDADDELLPYERRLLDSLFASGREVKVGSLKNTFAERLARVKDDLYADAIGRKWFARNPESQRQIWSGVAIALVVVGIGASVAAGFFLSRALIPVPLVLAGVVMLPLSRAMARRTAAGNEAYRRALGFKLYITTAETRRQEFNEQENIFARYLPYAIVFECVDKWAEAFEGLDDQVQHSTASWYSGRSAFEVGAFTAGMGSFAGSVSSTISSTPGSSGGSGFSGGGSSGGGGGGGGGSSW